MSSKWCYLLVLVPLLPAADGVYLLSTNPYQAGPLWYVVQAILIFFYLLVSVFVFCGIRAVRSQERTSGRPSAEE